MNEFLNWFSGFTAGEGCFAIWKGGRNIPTYRPRFQIKLRADDSEILETIKKELGFGNISNTRQFGTSKPCRMFMVFRKKDLPKLIKIFDKYPLRNKKQNDFLIWREAVNLLLTMPKGNRHHGARDWSQLAALKTKLEITRVYH